MEGLADTYWCNESTGDWLIGFAEKHVIYNNKVWDITHQIAKKDAYEVTISDGTTIKVSKEKKGLRKIVIGHAKPVTCSLITGTSMPDYPTKDKRKGFCDNGYRMGDSVTIVGWLKDMPQEAWEAGKEFSVVIENIFSDKEESKYAKMDSLGRFSITIPINNSSQAFLNWNRTLESTVLEPGETYFLLNDFKMGKKLFMGKNSRLQNELVTHPFLWETAWIEGQDQDSVAAMAFIAKTDSVRAYCQANLDSVVAVHPNLSQRYIDYVTGYYQMAQAGSLMQARFNVQHYNLPQAFMDYVGTNFWKKPLLPTTLYRDYNIFERDYLEQLTQGRQTIDIFERLNELKSLEFVKMSKEDDEVVANSKKTFAQAEEKESKLKTEEAVNKFVKAFNKSESVRCFNDLLKRKNIFVLNSYLDTKHVIDSAGADKNVRDIYLSKQFYQQINSYHVPLDSSLMEVMNREVGLPLARKRVTDLNDKYLAIGKLDISRSSCLRKASDVANMSDGEKILHKIVEPFKGKVVLLDIWGTWCGLCKEALSHSSEEYERLKNFDIQNLYLCNHSSDDSWKNTIKEYNVLGDNVTHYNLPDDQQNAVEKFLNVHAWPAYKLIDRKGNIHDVYTNPHDFESLANLISKM